MNENKMRFAKMADNGIGEIQKIYQQRGSEYADTMENTKWLTLINVLASFGCNITNEQARAVAIASLVDIKYWRGLGGLKMDNLIDGGAYNAYLIGELNNLKNERDSSDKE